MSGALQWPLELPRFGGQFRAFSPSVWETSFAGAVAGGLWETRSVFQGVWEGAGGWVGVAAFHTAADLRPG